MAWKLKRVTNAKNSIRENQVKLSDMENGTYSIEFTGKIIYDTEKPKEKIPIFLVKLDGNVKGESFVNVPADFPDEIKDSATLLCERYNVVVESGTITLVPNK